MQALMSQCLAYGCHFSPCLPLTVFCRCFVSGVAACWLWFTMVVSSCLFRHGCFFSVVLFIINGRIHAFVLSVTPCLYVLVSFVTVVRLSPPFQGCLISTLEDTVWFCWRQTESRIKALGGRSRPLGRDQWGVRAICDITKGFPPKKTVSL